jgi:glycosyltransferase involved in cell wall biosynthesis
MPAAARRRAPEAPGRPRVSVVIPAHDAARTLPRVLAPLAELPPGWELIVVDDHSRDETASLARAGGAEVVVSEGFRDHGMARNTGALHARGEIVVFVDADVVVTPARLQDMVRRFAQSGAVCYFGVYDLGRHLPNRISRFKNYWIRYTTVRSRRPLRWINTSLAVMRRRDLIEAGGFCARFSVRTGGGDLLLGRRLSERGRIEVDPRTEVKHLKEFDLGRLLRNDFHRARGWLRLAAEVRGIRRVVCRPTFANVRRRFSLGVALAGSLPLAGASMWLWPSTWPLGAGLLAAQLVLGLPMTWAAARDRVRGWPMFPLLLWVDQLCCAFALAVEAPCVVWHRVTAGRAPDGAAGAGSQPVGD